MSFTLTQEKGKKTIFLTTALNHLRIEEDSISDVKTIIFYVVLLSK